MEDLKQLILAFAEKNSKSKFYFNEMLKAVRKTVPDVTIKEVKDTASEMVKEEILDLYSTGSTSMYMIKEK